MSQFVEGSGLTYRQYLQAQSFVDDIRWSISDNSLKVAASVDALSDQGVKIERAVSRVSDGLDRVEHEIKETNLNLEQIDDTLVQGFVTLHFDLKNVVQSLTDMSALFEWGFGQLNTRLGAIHDTLEELLRTAKNPEQTWAFEQFDIARDAFERCLFEESLQYVTRAIHGYQSHTGYLLEHRFHYLLGALRLGDGKNTSENVVNLPEAEMAFLAASRYAESAYREDAARAMCCAGHAAYCQGKMDFADQYTKSALRFHEKLPQGHYQLARIRFRLKNIQKGLSSLKMAILLDPLYAIKCFDDGEFRPHADAATALITEMSEALRKDSLAKVDMFMTNATSFRRVFATRNDLFSACERGWTHIAVCDRSSAAESLLDQHRKQLDFGDLPYLDSSELAKSMNSVGMQLRSVINDGKQLVESSIAWLGTKPLTTAKKSNARYKHPGAVTFLISVIVSLIAGISSLIVVFMLENVLMDAGYKFYAVIVGFGAILMLFGGEFVFGCFVLLWMLAAWERLADSRYRADLRFEDNEHNKLIAQSEEMTRRMKADLAQLQQELTGIEAMSS